MKRYETRDFERRTGGGESRFIKMQKSRVGKISFGRIAANLFGFVSLAGEARVGNLLKRGKF